MGIRSFADTLGCSQLTDAADKYVQQYFYEVSLSEEFLSINGAELLEIVKKDELHVNSEEQVGVCWEALVSNLKFYPTDHFLIVIEYVLILKVFEAVMRWVKKEQDCRKSLLPQLLACVRMPLLKPHYLVDKVSTDQLIKSSHECRFVICISNQSGSLTSLMRCYCALILLKQ